VLEVRERIHSDRERGFKQLKLKPMAMALRTAVAAAVAPRGFRRLYSTTFTPPFNFPQATVAAQQREQADPSTNLFVSGKSISLSLSLFPSFLIIFPCNLFWVFLNHYVFPTMLLGFSRYWVLLLIKSSKCNEILYFVFIYISLFCVTFALVPLKTKCPQRFNEFNRHVILIIHYLCFGL
jgi:hypothetical protein